MECLLRDLLEIMMLLPVLLAAGYLALLTLEFPLGSDSSVPPSRSPDNNY